MQAKERDQAAARAREEQGEREGKRLAALERKQQQEQQAALVELRARELEQCRASKARVRPEPKRAQGDTLYFAALAIGKDNSWGEASGYSSREEAKRAALRNCSEHNTACKVQAWSNDCVAFARGTGKAAGWAWGVSRAEAERKATGFCEQHTTCCSVTASYCADEIQ